MAKFNIIITMMLFAMLAIACKSKHEKVAANDTSYLADKNYPYKNVASVRAIKMYFKDYKPYADPMFKDSLVRLTDEQKTQLLVPYIENKLGNGPGFVKHTECYFISKQKREMGFQPLLIRMSYKDGTVWYALPVLNRKNKVVNGWVAWNDTIPTLKAIKDSLKRVLRGVINR